jgi:hypothetical protein
MKVLSSSRCSLVRTTGIIETFKFFGDALFLLHAAAHPVRRHFFRVQEVGRDGEYAHFCLYVGYFVLCFFRCAWSTPFIS